MNLIEDYKDNWLISSVGNRQLEHELSKNVIERVIKESSHWTIDELQENYNQSVTNLCNQLGNNIFVALSGGIDSQLVCLSLIKNKVPFTAAIMMFENGFNSADVNHALMFCQLHDIEYVTVEVNIVDFLIKKLKVYVDKYQCSSPHFSSHFYFYEKLIDQYNASAILCGGSSPYLLDGRWTYGVTSPQLAWKNFKIVNNFNLIGDFVSYDFDLALLLMMTSQNIVDFSVSKKNEIYTEFVSSKKLAGFDILPQELKMTGFEKIKVYFNKLNNNSHVFDQWFRLPHEIKYPNYRGKFVIDTAVNDLLVSAAERIVSDIKHKYR